ncbi:glycosyltransferase [Oceanicoccus sagamiensis]|uniref:Uncharacterized protein n=1 Tax=Oceanicoccus sagamiensis TaxID=716816 RepID=A0A1X9NEW8_9GAMM|nr:glycosyltransferase [Oceanicoccus sagamiensis]ARN74089.1 hypothetical protein BST96_08115 [Oceanicoccus sagamiensis]
MRVCHVIGSMKTGGAERQFVNLINALEATSIHAIVLDDPSNSELGGLIDSRVQVHWKPVSLKLTPIEIVRLAKLIKTMHVDVIHTHMFWSAFYVIPAAALAGVKIRCTTEHGMNPWKTRFHHWFERYIISPLSDIRFCVSQAIKENRINTGDIPETKTALLTNGTEIKANSFSSWSGRSVKLLSVGRLIPAKDYDTLLLAAKLLKEQSMAFSLDILGDGALREPLQSKIDQLGLNDVVTLQGNQSNTQQWFEQSDIFVMSSLREGQPMALLEAMACALPIVSTRVGGIPATVLEGEEALLVDSGSAEQLAAAIESLCCDLSRSETIANNARQRVIDEFSIDAVAKAHLKIYSDLLEKH